MARLDRTSWASVGALVSILAVPGCEIIAFSTGSTGSASASSGTHSSTSVSASSSTTSSTSTGMTCNAPPPSATVGCAAGSDCETLCTMYEAQCSGLTKNAYRGPAGCCALCENFSNTGMDTAACRIAQLTKMQAGVCDTAGPWSTLCNPTASATGPNSEGINEYEKICGGVAPPMVSAIGRSAIADAADAAPNPKCQSVYCCYCAGAAMDSLPTCSMPLGCSLTP